MDQAVYTILINGTEAYTDLTENEFCDTMLDLAMSFYESGVPHPDHVTHKVTSKNYGKTEVLPD